MAQPILYIQDDPTYQELLKIRDSLFHLLWLRFDNFRWSSKDKTRREIESEILSAIQDLRANALYDAGKHDEFEKELKTLVHRITGWSFFEADDRKWLDSREDLQIHFKDLQERIVGEVCQKGEEAMLGEISLKPFLREVQESGDHDLKPSLKEEGKEEEEKEGIPRPSKTPSQREKPQSFTLRGLPPHGQPVMSISGNPTFIQLLEIRDSLFDLLDRKVHDSSAGRTTPELDQAIRTRIQHLENNALYSAGVKLTARQKKQLSKISRWHHDRYSKDRGLWMQKIRCQIIDLVAKIEYEVAGWGSLAMVGSLSLAPFLEEDEDQRDLVDRYLELLEGQLQLKNH